MYLKFVVVVLSFLLVLSFSCVANLRQLPPLWFSVGLLVVALSALYLFRHKQRLAISIPLVFAAGFAYASLFASYQLSLRLPDSLLGVETELIGTVVGLPTRSADRFRFRCKIESLSSVDTPGEVANSGLVRLTWYGKRAPDLQSGDKVKLVVKLKAPSGFMNPGGFDLERWLTQNRIIATGYVRAKSFDVSQSILSSQTSSLTSVRSFVQRRLIAASKGLVSQGVIVALSVGDRSGVDREQWDKFIATGTNHLLAISGLHISIVAGFAALLAKVLWPYTGIAQRSSRQTCSLCLALLAAILYAAMAGFTVPTLRALIMFSVLVFLVLLRRHQRRTHSLAVALLVVCLFDPLTVLSPGFWMSFAAVAVLFLVFSNAQIKGLVSVIIRLMRGHLLISVGLFPLTMLFFQQVSLIAPLANFVVTPLVALLVVPLVFISALLAMMSADLAAYVLVVVDVLLRITFSILDFLSGLPFALLKTSSVDPFTLILSGLVAFVLILPLPVLLRLFSLVLLLPLIYPISDSLSEGSYQLTFLDVGQGTAVVVRTRHHVLVYDTGDQFSSRFSAADAVLLPYLQHKNIKTVDKLIVSHADRDHSGGADEVLDNFKVISLMLSAPLPQRKNAPSVKCEAGQTWVWDQVQFSILHPVDSSTGSDNDLSCVLQISTAGGQRTLLSGDIESRAERQLLGRGSLQSAAVLLAPHHGSNSSSTSEFVQAVGAKHVIFTTGFQNRFGFPKQDVVERYTAAGSELYDTALSGAIEIKVSDKEIFVAEYRKTDRRWWHRSAVSERQ